MELPYRPTWVKKSDVAENPKRYFVLDGSMLPSVMNIPVQLRDAITPQLLDGPVRPIIPFDKMSNDFCTIISSDIATNPRTKQPGFPYYAFLPPFTESLSYSTQFMSNPKEGPVYLGIVLNERIPNLVLRSVNIIVRFGVPKTNNNNIEGVTHLAPVPAEYQLFGTMDSLKPGQTADDLNWQVISNETTVLPDVWAIHAPTQLSLYKEGMDEKLVRWHGFKFVVYKWHMDANTADDPIPGLARFSFNFTQESLDALKFLPYHLPDGAALIGEDRPDEVVAYDLEQLEESKKPDAVQPEINASDLKKLFDEMHADAERQIREHVDSMFDKLEKAVKNQVNTYLDQKFANISENISAFQKTLESLPKVPSESEVKNMVRNSVSSTLQNPNGPFFTTLDAFKQAIGKLETKLSNVEDVAGDNSDVTSAVIMDNLNGRAYALESPRDMHHFYIFNRKDAGKTQLECSLPVNRRPGTALTVTNYRTDGGRVQILCKKGTLNVIYQGRIYPAMPSLAMTNFGESLDLVFDGEKWYGTLTDGVQKKTK